MIGAIDFMKHWRQCCKDEKDCKGCFIEDECQAFIETRDDKTILRLIEKVEKRYVRRYDNGKQ